MDNTKKYRDVAINFDVLNNKEFGITVKGDPSKVTSYLVMNVSTNYMKSYLTGLLANVAEDDPEKDILMERLKSLPKEDIISPFKITLDKDIFNRVMKTYKIPINIFPREVPSGEVELAPMYLMTAEPAKIVIKYFMEIHVNPFDNWRIPASTPFLHGVPRKYVNTNLFDCEIQLDKQIVTTLLMEGGLEIKDRDISHRKFIRRG